MFTSGAIIWATGLLLGSTLHLAVSAAAHHKQIQAAETLNVLSNACWLPFIAGIAVTLLGAGMTVLSTGLLPKWLGWIALAVGVISLIGPGGFAGFFAGPLFLLVAGLILAFRSPATDPAT